MIRSSFKNFNSTVKIDDFETLDTSKNTTGLLPERTGQHWTLQEKFKLHENWYTFSGDLYKIANAHKRTIKSVAIQLSKNPDIKYRYDKDHINYINDIFINNFRRNNQ